MRTNEVETLVEQYLERLQGIAVAALRQAVADVLMDAVECRQRIQAAERAASRGFMRQMPAAAFE